MVILFKHVNDTLSVGTFNGVVVEVKKLENKNEWVIYNDNKKVKSDKFYTREKAIRHVNLTVEKIVMEKLGKVTAVQKSFSPRIIRPIPFTSKKK